jgi:hypothetical protein
MSTESDNERYRNALEQYKQDRDKIKRIREILKEGATVMPMDIEWLCQIANDGINNKESSWYDHG